MALAETGSFMFWRVALLAVSPPANVGGCTTKRTEREIKMAKAKRIDRRGGDRHKIGPLGVRLPVELREQLDRYMAETGQNRNAFVVEAIEKLLNERTGR